MIPVFSNTLGKEELAAVERVFASRWLGRGKECAAFEQEFARYLRTDKVLLTNCATSALYLAVRALGIGAGDEVIIPTINFVACASAVIEAGATPVFADVDKRTLNILPSEIDRLRTEHTRAVMVLHYGGHPAPMAHLRERADDLFFIEDAANAVASTYAGHACGTLGDAGVWSFDSMKELVMADGGALWLGDEEARARAESLRYLGLANSTKSGMDSAAGAVSRWWEYEVDEPSGRFISNDVLAAIGRVQLKRLSGFIARRKVIWETYQEQLPSYFHHEVYFEHYGHPHLTLPPEPLEGCTSSYYLYWIQTDRRDELAKYLYENGVYTTFRYYPLHRVKRFASGQILPIAERVNDTTLNLPIHQNLSAFQQERIITLIRRFFE